MQQIDRWSYASALRPVHADTKFWFAVITILICIIGKSVPAACITLVVNSCLTVYKGKIPLRYYLGLFRVPLFFLILSTITITFDTRSPLSSIQLLLTALASISSLYFLALSTPISDLLLVLKRLKCPALMIELMLLIYRFLFVISDQTRQIRNAQTLRLGYQNFRLSLHSFGTLLSVVLVKSLKRASIQYDAMESRCFTGEIRMLTTTYPPRRKAVLLFILCDVLLIGVSIWTHIY